MINVRDHGIGAAASSAIDNLVESYTVSADGNLNAGDLCEFINGQVRKTVYASTTSVATQATSIYPTGIRSLVLDATHVLVSWCGTSTFIWAVVLTVSGVTVTVGTVTQINSITCYSINLVLLDPTHVLLSYANALAYSQVLTITGNTITMGAAYQINGTQTDFVTVARLSPTSVVVSYQNYQNSYYAWAVALAISGNIITVGTPVVVIGSPSANNNSIAIDANRVLTMSTLNTNGYLYGVVLTIAGVVITVGTSVLMSTNNCSYVNSTLLDLIHVLISYSGTSAYLSLVVVTITGTTITMGVVLVTTAVAITIATGLLDSTHVLLTYQAYSGNFSWAVVVTITGLTVAVGAYYQVTSVASSYSSVVALDSAHGLFSYQNGSAIWNTVLGITGNVVSNVVVTNASRPNVICITPTVIGVASKFGIKGIFGGLSGLIPNATYYCDSSGNLTTTITGIKMGVALSTTELLIKKAFWERV